MAAIPSLDKIVLDTGSHRTREDGVCFNEAAAWFAGQPHTDAPPCVSPVIRTFTMRLNDWWPDEQRQQLVPYIPKVLNTATGHDRERAWLAFDWAIHEALPIWLDRAGLAAEATMLRELPAHSDLTEYRRFARTVLSEVRATAWSRRSDALARVREAAAVGEPEVAAVAVAVEVAAVAAEAAATTAAAVAEATEAAWSRSYSEWLALIRPKVEEELAETLALVRAGALELLDRMIAAGRKTA